MKRTTGLRTLWLSWLFLLPAVLLAQSGDSLRVVDYLKKSKLHAKSSYQMGLLYADSARQLAHDMGLTEKEMVAQRMLGILHYQHGEYDTALRHLGTVYAYFNANGNKKEAARSLNNLGIVHRDQGNTQEALQLLLDALAINEELDNIPGAASNLLNIGVLFAVKENLESALEYFKRAGTLFQEIGDSNSMATVYLNMAGIHGDQQNYAAMKKEANFILPYLRRKKMMSEWGRAEYILGRAHQETGDYGEAEKHYITSHKIFEELGSKVRMSGCKLRLSEMALDLNFYFQATALAQEALATAQAVPSPNLVSQAYELLAQIFEKKGDYEQALKYSKSYHQINDSLNSIEKEERIAQLDERYQRERKEKEVKALQLVNQQKELEINRQRSQKRLFVALTISVLFFLVIIFFQVRTKQRVNQELQEKGAIIQKNLEEREVLLAEIHHRVKNNLQFISSLFSLQTRYVQDERAREVLKESRDRIQSMALVHVKLYQEGNLLGVYMPDYLETLVESLARSSGLETGSYHSSLAIAPVRLDVDTAVPLGMIVNELLTNSIKYANTNPLHLELTLTHAANRLELVVADNGAGFKGTAMPESETGFGYRLIQNLLKKLDASLEVQEGPGARIKLVINEVKTV